MSSITPKTLLAFCHIEKAAGTSLIHILRRVFFLRYAAVSPLNSAQTDYFTAGDLQTALRINPILAGFGGHSVVPHNDLVTSHCRIQFITQARDPIARAESHFRFWVNRMSLGTTWQEFLDHPASQNFQVKKLAGCEDVGLAKEHVRKHFLVAGTVRQFDEFLVLLARKLGAPLELFVYRKQNVARNRDEKPLPDVFYDELRRRNSLDRELYDWIENELFPSYIAAYPGDFAGDLSRFKALQAAAPAWRFGAACDFLYRNVYLKPTFGMTRVVHGLPYRGSYATR